MKIALYIEEGVEQIVLTPDTEYEKKMLALLTDAERVVSIRQGTFYPTRGGWIRHGDEQDGGSTMLVIERKDATRRLGEEPQA
jgi:hypothetical protein